ncbi:MAG: hypothetical protein U1E84_05075 [Rhodoferax sp.]
MSTFDPLTWTLDDWFDSQLCDLPDALRQRVKQVFFPMPWDKLTADQRRSVALQMDCQHDPATAQDQKFWWEFFERVDSLKKQLAEWEGVAAPTAADLALKETRLTELKQELARMDAQQRTARGDYYPVRKSGVPAAGSAHAEQVPETIYIAYPKAIHQLAQRLGATPEELAAWIWMGPKEGGIAAYMNANELNPPPRFFYATGSDSQDYIAPLMACWFKADDIDQFTPADRFITGKALIERWSKRPGLQPAAFIRAKIAESRLLDAHPIYGGTRGTFSEHRDWPPLETGLFTLEHVRRIEAEDFAEASTPVATKPPEVGTPEWRKQNAQAAASARHSQPGGSRDKQNQIRAIWASGKYKTRDICAEQECAALNMSIKSARNALVNEPDPPRC